MNFTYVKLAKPQGSMVLLSDTLSNAALLKSSWRTEKDAVQIA